MLEWLPIEASRLYLFLGASLAVLITPGMAVLYIVGNSLDRGPLAGIVSSLGISLGGIFQVFGAALGVTVLLQTSTLAPMIITYLGAGYFIYLGIKRLKEPPATEIQHPGNKPLMVKFSYKGWS
ncbi:MAG: LysE family transporter [Sphingomonadales bacterium]